jgi:hypothetical protein
MKQSGTKNEKNLAEILKQSGTVKETFRHRE